MRAALSEMPDRGAGQVLHEMRRSAVLILTVEGRDPHSVAPAFRNAAIMRRIWELFGRSLV